MVATRASDADRESCLEDIQAAYVDGRINDAEREARTQAALQATTLAELADLVADLGPAAKLPKKVAKGRSPKAGADTDGALSKRFLLGLLLVTLVPAVAAVVLWISATGDDADEGGDDPAAPAATSETEVPKERLELHTAAGFEKLVAMTKAKFGTTIVDSAAIYPDYASIEVLEKDDERRAENWYFAKGFEGEPSKGTRPPDATTIDLAAVNPTAYARAVRRSPAVLGVEDVISTYVVIQDSGDGPTFSVYVRNDYSENGYWTFTLDGKELRRYAFE